MILGDAEKLILDYCEAYEALSGIKPKGVAIIVENERFGEIVEALGIEPEYHALTACPFLTATVELYPYSVYLIEGMPHD